MNDFENSIFCNVIFKGGYIEFFFVFNDEFFEEGFIIYVKVCFSRWFYVLVEGVNEINMFNLILFKDFIRIMVGLFYDRCIVLFVNFFFFIV